MGPSRETDPNQVTPTRLWRMLDQRTPLAEIRPPGSANHLPGYAPGDKIAHYQIERRLGAGGMSEVYLAEDAALGRLVALKVLPRGFAASLRERLLREGWASARLQHPTIATFFEAGEVDGIVFIAMEYVEGQTLRERLEQQGPLPLPEALAVAGCMLEALGHAHAAGILHRDIKPENIMLTGPGTAKLLDFGMAKPWLLETEMVLPPSRWQLDRCEPLDPDQTGEYRPSEAASLGQADGLTLPGGLAGTPGYLSPEQAIGAPLDARSDLFLVGLVLYEMLTGQRAYPGKHVLDRVTPLLTGEGPDLSVASLPVELGPLLQQALAFAAEERFATAGEFLIALRQVHDSSLPAFPDTLAVLSFVNQLPAAEDAWLTEALAEGLAKNLASLPGVRVTPRRQGVAPWTGSASDPTNPLELGCRWQVCGSIEAIAGGIRVLTRLTEVPTGIEQVLPPVEGSVEQLLELQQRLRDGLADRLHKPLPHDPVQAGTTNAAVFEHTMRGRQLSLQIQKGTIEDARYWFHRALQLEPDYAPAVAGLASTYALQFPYTTDPEDLHRAIDHARQAIALDDNLAESYIWMSYALRNLGHPLDAYPHIARALELAPEEFSTWYFASGIFSVQSYRRHEAAELYRVVMNAACSEDPHRWRWEQGLECYQEAVALNSQFQVAWLGMSICHLGLGNLSEARWILERTVRRESEGNRSAAGAGTLLGECLRKLKMTDEAHQATAASLHALERSDHIYRDTLRGLGLRVLGSLALDQGDDAAAEVAFTQTLQLLHGRLRARAGGHVLAQALAGLARVRRDLGLFQEAVRLVDTHADYNFQTLWLCSEEVTLLELARAALALGETEASRHFRDEAIDYGSWEAQELPV